MLIYFLPLWFLSVPVYGAQLSLSIDTSELQRHQNACHPPCRNNGLCALQGKEYACFCAPPYGGPGCNQVVDNGEESVAQQINAVKINSTVVTATYGGNDEKVHPLLRGGVTPEQDEAKMIQILKGLSANLMEQIDHHAINIGKTDTKEMQNVLAEISKMRAQQEPVLPLLPPTAPPTQVQFELFMTAEDPLITSEENAKLYLWSSLCDDMAPCSASLFLEDVTVVTFEPLRIVFNILPSSNLATVATVIQKLQELVANPNSVMKKYFTNLDTTKSIISEIPIPTAAPVTQAPVVVQPQEEQTEPPAPPPNPLTLEMKIIPMSTTMICIMMLTFQFFLIFSILFAARMLQNLNWGKKRRPVVENMDDSIPMTQLSDTESEEEKPSFKFIPILEQCKSTVFFAPMLSILFLATRMRALQITKGTGAPPPFTQDCMYGVSFTVALQMIFILVKGSIDLQGLLKLVGLLIELLEKLVMVVMYAGTLLIIISALSMTPATCLSAAYQDYAASLWPDGVPFVSPALLAVLNLTVQFFVIYLGIKIMETINRFCEKDDEGIPIKAWIITWTASFDLARATVNFAPMLAILFVGVRMRALDIDPVNGSPQVWAQVCFHLCTYGIMAQALLVFLGPPLGVTAEKGQSEGDIVYKSSNRRVEITLQVFRYLTIILVYGGFVAVIISVFTIMDQNGIVPPMAPATAAVIYLSVLYLGVFLIFFIIQSIAQFERWPCTTTFRVLNTAILSVEFAPMLSVLFLATRMRSREVRLNGAPPGWAQDAMLLGVVAIIIQLITNVLSGIFGYFRLAIFHLIGGLVNIAKTIGLIILYVAIIIVCTAAVIMSPEIANGKGSLLHDGDPTNNFFEPPPPFSTTVQCILILVFQFFAINAAVFIGHQVCNALDIDRAASPILQICERCKSTVFFAPMLSILFIGTRMRSLQLTQGHGAPQPWAQKAMFGATFAILGQLLLIVASGAFDRDSKIGRMGAMIIDFLEKVVMIAMYGGMALVVYAVLIMTPASCMPHDTKLANSLWGEEGPPMVSPAIFATIALTAQFFIVYIGVKVMETIVSFSEKDEDGIPKKEWILTWQMIFDMAKATVNFAPMLCILFIGARMRALEIDPKNGAPQWYAQMCFFLCAGAVAFQAVVVLLSPVAGISVEKGDVEGDVKFKAKRKYMTVVLAVFRWISLIAIYGGAALVIVSIITITDAQGNVPKISPALQNVIIMTVQYFVVYLAVMITFTIQQVGNVSLPTAMGIMISFIRTADICPMLSVLFIATRMRAIDITDGGGGPPGWVQDAMYLASFAVLCQMVLVIGEKISIVGMLQAVAWFVTLGAALVICLGIMIMTPHTATGKGSVIAPLAR